MTRFFLCLTAVVGVLIAVPSAQARTTHCTGSIAVGNVEHGQSLTGYDFVAQNLSCPAAGRIGRQFLSKKLYGHPAYQCADDANSKEGCIVGNFLCYSQGPPLRSECVDGDLLVRFRERDRDEG